MMGYRFTGPAREDLFETWEFIARDDLDAADRMIAGLEAAAEELVAHPQIGRSRPALAAPEIRFLSVGAYLLVYRATEEEIEVLRVLHGARDLDALLGGE